MKEKKMYEKPRIEVLQVVEEELLQRTSFGSKGEDGNGHNAAEDEDDPNMAGAKYGGWFFEENEEDL